VLTKHGPTYLLSVGFENTALVLERSENNVTLNSNLIYSFLCPSSNKSILAITKNYLWSVFFLLLVLYPCCFFALLCKKTVKIQVANICHQIFVAKGCKIGKENNRGKKFVPTFPC